MGMKTHHADSYCRVVYVTDSIHILWKSVITKAATVWRASVTCKNSRAEVSKLQRISCLLPLIELIALSSGPNEARDPHIHPTWRCRQIKSPKAVSFNKTWQWTIFKTLIKFVMFTVYWNVQVWFQILPLIPKQIYQKVCQKILWWLQTAGNTVMYCLWNTLNKMENIQHTLDSHSTSTNSTKSHGGLQIWLIWQSSQKLIQFNT